MLAVHLEESMCSLLSYFVVVFKSSWSWLDIFLALVSAAITGRSLDIQQRLPRHEELDTGVWMKGVEHGAVINVR